jgi:catechol 2,3-dioxygenase-like lactoylglutathione lyase family enzyme
MTIQRLENVGIVVDDLAAATTFFVELGLKVLGEGPVEGGWVDRVVGLGIRRVAFAVDDIDAAVAGLQARGAELLVGWSATKTPTGSAMSAARRGSSSCFPSRSAEAPYANRLRHPLTRTSPSQHHAGSPRRARFD